MKRKTGTCWQSGAALWSILFAFSVISQFAWAQEESSQEESSGQTVELKAEVVDGKVIITTNGKTQTIDLEDLESSGGVVIQAQIDSKNGKVTESKRAILVSPEGNQHVILDGDFDTAARLNVFQDMPGLNWNMNSDMRSGMFRLHGGQFVIGIDCRNVGDALKSHMDLEHGLVVEVVQDESAADKAGIQRFDILLKADGEPLANVTDLTTLIEKAGEEGEELDVVLVRKGKKQKLSLKPGKRENRFVDVTAEFALPQGQFAESFSFDRVLPGLIQGHVDVTEMPDFDAITNEIAELRKEIEQLRKEIRNK